MLKPLGRPSLLVAQFTTAGDISGQIQVQIFYNGNNQDEFREVLPILTACNDPEVLNYEPLHTTATTGASIPKWTGCWTW